MKSSMPRLHKKVEEKAQEAKPKQERCYENQATVPGGPAAADVNPARRKPQ